MVPARAPLAIEEARATPEEDLEVKSNLVEEEDFESRMLEKYASFSLGQLLDARLALREELNGLTRVYYETEFAAGRYETHFLEPDELGRRAIPNVPGELSSLLYKPGGEVHLVRLPREGFEEAYGLSKEANWLLLRKAQLEREAKTIRSQ